MLHSKTAPEPLWGFQKNLPTYAFFTLTDPVFCNAMARRSAMIAAISIAALIAIYHVAAQGPSSEMENDQMAEMFGGQRFGRGKDKKVQIRLPGNSILMS